jgi:hypothetical protein
MLTVMGKGLATLPLFSHPYRAGKQGSGLLSYSPVLSRTLPYSPVLSRGSGRVANPNQAGTYRR